MNLEAFLLIVAAVLAVPGGLFLAYLLTDPRARWAALVGALVGDALVGLGLWYFVRADSVNIDGLSYWFGVFFGCTIGVVIGALVADWLVGLASRNRSDLTVER